MDCYNDHLSYRAELLTFGYRGRNNPGPMPRDLREAISEHEMLMGDLLDKADKDREQFELDACKLAKSMRTGASLAFTRAAEVCLDEDQPDLAKKFYFLANNVLEGPLTEVGNGKRK